MRISDWSSDVCSSDLGHGGPDGDAVVLDELQGVIGGEATLGHHQLETGQGAHHEGGVRARHVEQRRGEQGDVLAVVAVGKGTARSEEHTSELPSLMRISFAGFRLKIKKTRTKQQKNT